MFQIGDTPGIFIALILYFQFSPFYRNKIKDSIARFSKEPEDVSREDEGAKTFRNTVLMCQ
jgi:hypothetical protein